MLLKSDFMQGLDPVRFCETINFEPDLWQEQALRHEGKRIILNCTRQGGKSSVAAIKALNTAIYISNSLTLITSPTFRQSGELFKKVGEYSKNMEFLPEKEEDNRLSLTFRNDSRIVSLPGKEGNIRSYSGATLIIIDEASRVADDTYKAMRPMLAVSGGTLILMSTPWGKRGFFYEEYTSNHNWERIEIDADECPRISKEFLAEEKEALGDIWYQQEYYCKFMDTVDQVFATEFIERAITDEVRPLFEENPESISEQDPEPMFAEVL